MKLFPELSSCQDTQHDVPAHGEKSLTPSATISPANFFLGKHWTLKKPELFNFAGHANELSHAVCEFNVQEIQQLSDHSPGVQARGATHLGAACPLLRCYHLF